MKSLKQFVEEADASAVQIFATRGEVLPMYHVVNGDDTEHVFEPPSPDKNTSVALVRAALAFMEAKRVVFITEAWMAIASGEEESRATEEFMESNSLEHWDGRKECLIYMAEDAKEGALMFSREILREENQPPRLGPLECKLQDGSHSGRMVGLLPTTGRSH